MNRIEQRRDDDGQVMKETETPGHKEYKRPAKTQIALDLTLTHSVQRRYESQKQRGEKKKEKKRQVTQRLVQ